MPGQVQPKRQRTDLARPVSRTEIVAACAVIAAAGLLAMTSHPGSAVNESPGSGQTAATDSPALRPVSRIKESPLAELLANEAPRSYVVDSPQHDAPSPDETATPDDLVFLAQPHSSRFDRFEAISALGDSHDAMAELALVGLLHDPDPAIRESAVESLAYLGTYGAVQGLGYALTDADPLVRLSALEFLAEIGTPDALQALAVTFGDPDADLRMAAVYELADADSEAALGLLQQFLSDADPAVRNTAAELLND
jgi:HEAT repeat protein